MLQQQVHAATASACCNSKCMPQQQKLTALSMLPHLLANARVGETR
jgi:hypothetical protein